MPPARSSACRYGMIAYTGASKSLEGLGRVRRRRLLLRARAAAALERRRPRGVAAHRGHPRPARHAARGQRLARARQPVHPDRRLLPAARVSADGRDGAAAAPAGDAWHCCACRVPGAPSTTLEDDSLLAGAFLCYVTWALAGWRWLVAAGDAVHRLSRGLAAARRTTAGASTGGRHALGLGGGPGWLALSRNAERAVARLSVHPGLRVSPRASSAFSRLAHRPPPIAGLRGLAQQAIAKSWALVLIPL